MGVIIVLAVVVVLKVVLEPPVVLINVMRSLSRCWAKAEGGIALALRVGTVAVGIVNLLVVRFALWDEYLNLVSESLVIMISLLSRKFTKPKGTKIRVMLCFGKISAP